MENKHIKKYDNFLNEGDSGVSWSKILFGKTIKEIWDDIYSEINPVLKWRKMEKYHQRLKDDVEQLKIDIKKGEKELEEKKKIVQDLENKIKERKNGEE